MSRLTVDQKNIERLFTDKNADFLIPDYQRPYAWNEVECQTLWDDIFDFAFPDNNKDNFNTDDEYFLGSIVTFNNGKQLEVIDGQQRLTTLLLLLRAFYDKFENMGDEYSKKTRERIAKCIWQINEMGDPDTDKIKIDSDVALDDEKEDFILLLKNGNITTKKNKYVKNYKFIEQKIDEFINKFPSYFQYLPARILNNCILLPIEADNQETALRIFSTLNDRGLPLADSDIFKAQLYKYYLKLNKKDEFMDEWKVILDKSNEIFKPIKGTPMDELFTKYMYFLRAGEENKSTTTEALRKFYEFDNYKRLLNNYTIENLKELVDFWDSIYKLDAERFSKDVLKKLYILRFAPNSMWEYITSIYFLANKAADNKLNDEAFSKFLSKITAFIYAYAITNPGVNSLRTPIYAEMMKAYKKEDVDFSDFKFDEVHLKNALNNFYFSNNKNVTRSLLTWYAFENENQAIPELNKKFQIEHIYSRNREQKEKKLQDNRSMESLGNKILLEDNINIGASDYKFDDKKIYYKGYTDKKGNKHVGSMIYEFEELCKKNDFLEDDIKNRENTIISKFIEYLKSENLIK